jgi:uncharacterized membrane protein YadS
MIDVSIGVICFIPEIVSTYVIEKKPGARVSSLMIWYRFPKFVIGYIFTSAVLSLLAYTYATVAAGQAAVAPVANFGTTNLQVMFFVFTFTAIGITTRFSNLRQVGLGKPVMVYVIALLFAIFWGGIMAYAFFSGLS